MTQLLLGLLGLIVLWSNSALQIAAMRVERRVVSVHCAGEPVWSSAGMALVVHWRLISSTRQATPEPGSDDRSTAQNQGMPGSSMGGVSYF